MFTMLIFRITPGNFSINRVTVKAFQLLLLVATVAYTCSFIHMEFLAGFNLASVFNQRRVIISRYISLYVAVLCHETCNRNRNWNIKVSILVNRFVLKFDRDISEMRVLLLFFSFSFLLRLINGF